jgi:hypothetical protein
MWENKFHTNTKQLAELWFSISNSSIFVVKRLYYCNGTWTVQVVETRLPNCEWEAFLCMQHRVTAITNTLCLLPRVHFDRHFSEIKFLNSHDTDIRSFFTETWGFMKDYGV